MTLGGWVSRPPSESRRFFQYPNGTPSTTTTTIGLLTVACFTCDRKAKDIRSLSIRVLKEPIRPQTTRFAPFVSNKTSVKQDV